ncbi:hypothetical protein F5Y08DRAFT_324195 [Xylaria arbuscula]|nr:hypothetical protein F5Y08DRAFT_324195 [Xylaria arbuscula]
MRRCVVSSGFLAAALAIGVRSGESVADSSGPREEIARVRAPEIFNAVNNAMRQWGSSLHHNGMSFFLATVPEGVLLHHGNASPLSPSEPDWLAFEIEHAENFARGRRDRPKGGPGRPQGRGPARRSQRVLEAVDDEDDDNESHGYLHVYKTMRSMRYIYVDGMGAGKTSMGTLDSQDLILRGKSPEGDAEPTHWLQDHEEGDLPPKGPRGGGPMDERQRAMDLCELARKWGLDGIIRMEAGFEIIQCDFSDGLEQVQALQRPQNIEPDHKGFGNLEQFRGLAERYQGIGSTRVIIDYSSMVSAFFFPINITNSDAKRQDLPRLSSAKRHSLDGIKAYVANIVHERINQTSRIIDWQDVTDMIVARYADRLKLMAEEVHNLETMASEVNFLANVFIDNRDGSDKTDKAITRCTHFYLRPVSPVTEPDVLIKAALETTSQKICQVLLQVHQLVVDSPSPDQTSLDASVNALKQLTEYLNWPRFKRCPPCAIDEVCLIPMWPFGTVDQYSNPRCSNGTTLDGEDSYWGHGPGRRPGGKPPKPGGSDEPWFFSGSEL